VFKKIFSLGLATFVLLACNTCFAEMTDSDYHGGIAKLHSQIKDAYHDYVHAKANIRKMALEQIDKLGRSPKDAKTRKTILRDCEKKEADLKEAYKAKKNSLLNKEKALWSEYKESRQKTEIKKSAEE